MAVTVLDFEGGTPGATVAADATSGFDNVLIDGGEAMVYTSTAGEYFHGTRGVKISAATTAAHGYGEKLGISTAQVAVDACFKWPSVSTADFHQIRLMDSGGVSIATLLMNSAGKIRLLGASSSTVFTLTAATPTAAWVRLKLWVQPGASTSTGSAILEVWNADTSTNVAGTTYSTTTANFGTALIDRIRWGNIGNYAATYMLDLAGYDPAATGLMPDLGGNIAPTITSMIGTQNVAASATVNLTSAATDTDGTIGSRLWDYVYPSSGGPSITGATSANATFTAGAAGSLYVPRMTVTDNSGATAVATTEVRVPLATEINPVTGYGGTGVPVTKVGASANEETTLGTGTVGAPDDTKYLEFPTATGTAQARRWRLEPSVPLTSGTFTHRLALASAGSVTINARLYQGAAVKASWTIAGVTTSFADYTTTLTPTQAGMITDWGNLWIEYEEV